MIRKFIVENKKTILGIIFSPVVMYVFNVFVLFIFHLGTYVGTCIRYLYNGIIC